MTRKTTAPKNGTSHAARAKVLSEQVPYALDRLAARRPAIGFIRSILNQDGVLDKFIVQFTRENTGGKDDNPLACARDVLVIHAEPDAVREEMAKALEKEFGLDG